MKVEQVTTIEELDKVWELVYQEYVRMGYSPIRPDKKIDEHHKLDLTAENELYTPTTVFFIQNDSGHMIGTVSATRDGSEGLHTDETYKTNTQFVRDLAEYENGEAACVWRIVVEHGTSFKVVMLLIDEVIKWANQWCPHYILCTFNPNQEGFYTKFIGMQKIDEAVIEIGLTNAPSVLMLWGSAHFNDWTLHRMKRHS